VDKEVVEHKQTKCSFWIEIRRNHSIFPPITLNTIPKTTRPHGFEVEHAANEPSWQGQNRHPWNSHNTHTHTHGQPLPPKYTLVHYFSTNPPRCRLIKIWWHLTSLHISLFGCVHPCNPTSLCFSFSLLGEYVTLPETWKVLAIDFNYCCLSHRSIMVIGQRKWLRDLLWKQNRTESQKCRLKRGCGSYWHQSYIEIWKCTQSSAYAHQCSQSLVVIWVVTAPALQLAICFI